ncbi:MAG: hypothetical protein ACYTGB_03435, partial [Planctomycetota bacterium]
MSQIVLLELVVIAGIVVPTLLVAGIFLLVRRPIAPDGRRRRLRFLRMTFMSFLGALAGTVLL